MSKVYPSTIDALAPAELSDLTFKYPQSSQKYVSRNSYVPETLLPLTQTGWHHIKWYHFIEIIFCAIFLAVPRVLLMLITTVLTLIICNLGLIGIKNDNPVKPDIHGLRRLSQMIGRVLYRSVFFCLGVWYVEIKGKPAKMSEAPIQVMSPHSTMLDTVIVALSKVSPIANSGNTSWLPIRLIMPLLVDRTDKKSRNKISEEIHRRSKNSEEGWYPILVYPEATTHNGSTHIRFKPGAFSPGLPVQPVYLEIQSEPDFITWPVICPKWYIVLLMNILRIRHKITIHYLPVYHPNDDEKADPELYAFNVRKQMSVFSKLPVFDLCYEDVRFLEHFKSKYHSDYKNGVVKVFKLYQVYGATYKDVENALHEHMTECEGVLDEDTKCCKLDVFASIHDRSRMSMFKDLEKIEDFDSETGSVSVGAAIEWKIMNMKQKV